MHVVNYVIRATMFSCGGVVAGNANKCINHTLINRYAVLEMPVWNVDIRTLTEESVLIST